MIHTILTKWKKIVTFNIANNKTFIVTIGAIHKKTSSIEGGSEGGGGLPKDDLT